MLYLIYKYHFELDNTVKIVILSGSVDNLKVVSGFLSKKFPEIGVYNFFGQQKNEINNRMAQVKINNPDDHSLRIMCLSIRAGATGLNLQGANVCIQYTPEWNPAVTQQGDGRIDRLTQKKDCFFYNLIMTGLLDDRIYQAA